MKKILSDKKFWLCTIGVWGCGLLGGIFAVSAKMYYKVLILPPFAPPAFLFGPVWTVLYLLMGISFYLILTMDSTANKKMAIWLFSLQFLLNFIWSPIFFIGQNNLLAAIDITILWLLLVMLQLTMLKARPVVMWLMGPYFLWVSFATVLTYAILMLN
ncbi:MAG: TspO/MBR family protein [Culicoidibacterales bacterium]